jgi:acyl transferase domain-containing protein
LGLTGPALSLQTACSSGLVVAATACQHLLDGSCDAALAVASSLTLPAGGGYFSTADSIFSPDGICRPFDAAANGTFVGDGVCAVMLKRLADTQEDDDRILGVIRGWAVNNDGHRKIGFFAPSAEGQQEVLRDAAAAADIDPGDLDYIETHGTGTRLGDPIEFQAIKTVHGHPDHELGLSSVKASIGHLGAAAGLAGLIRTTLALKNNIMPGTLNFEKLNPVIKTDDCHIQILSQPQPFPEKGRPARAAVSSFGIGGTNAHMILEAAPLSPPAHNETDEGTEVIVFSGIDEAAVARAKARMRDWLQSDLPSAVEDGPPSIACMADTALFHRKAFPYRSSVIGKTRDELVHALTQAEKTQTCRKTPDYPNICFVFTGSGVPSGSHAQAMANRFPAFRAALKAIDDELSRNSHPDISPWLFQDKAASAERNLAQSHLGAFAFGYAHARLWQSMGLTPSLLIGHSMGEITAACIAESISLKDALSFVIERAAIIETHAQDGELIAVAWEAADIKPRLAGYTNLSISGHNGDGQTLVAGPREEIDHFAEALRGDDIALFMLPAGRPFHSPRMQATSAPIAKAADSRFRQAVTPLASTVTGKLETDRIADPGYWAAQMTTPVDLTGAIDAALAAGCTFFLELGPRPTFASGARRTIRNRDAKAQWHSALTLPAKQSDLDIDVVVARSRATLFEAGFQTAAPHRRRAALTAIPNYPFARLRHWRDEHRADGKVAPIAVSLPEPTQPSPAMIDSYVSSDDAEELLRALLAEIWAQELGLDSIPPEASFHNLGGTSLTALKVVGEIDRQVGLRPALTSLVSADSFNDFVTTITDLLLDEGERASACACACATDNTVETIE